MFYYYNCCLGLELDVQTIQDVLKNPLKQSIYRKRIKSSILSIVIRFLALILRQLSAELSFPNLLRALRIRMIFVFLALFVAVILAYFMVTLANYFCYYSQPS